MADREFGTAPGAAPPGGVSGPGSPAEEFSVPAPETESTPPRAEEEFTPPPGSDHENPAPEREFTPPGSGGTAPPEGRKRRLRKFAFLAAGVALILLMTFRAGTGTTAPVSPGGEPVPGAADVTPAPDGIYTTGGDISGDLLAGLTATPAPTEEPQEFRYELVFFDFSAYHNGYIKLFHQEAVRSVLLEIMEANFDTVEWSYELSEEDIANGYYEIPTFDDADTYYKYEDRYDELRTYPLMKMRATITLDGEDGPETVTDEHVASYEQGWGVRYFPDDYEPRWSDEEYYPGCFAVMSWEAYDDYPDMHMGSYEDAEKRGEICIELSLNGVPVPADGYAIVTHADPTYYMDDEGNLTESGRFWYYTTVVIPRPDDAPLSGTAHLRVNQRLEGYDIVWVTERDFAYGPTE